MILIGWASEQERYTNNVEWVKTTAKTVPEAIELALDNLGVDEAEAEIVVIEEPSKGLFGRMRGSARVEARIKPRSIRPKVDRSRNRRDGRAGERGKRSKRSRDRGPRNRDDSRTTSTSKQGTVEEKSGRGQRSGSDPDAGQDSSRHQTGTKEAEPTAKAGAPSGDRGGSAGDSGSGKRRRRRRGSGSGQKQAARTDPAKNSDDGARQADRAATSTQSSNKADGARPPQEETPVQDVADQLKTFLGGLTEAFGLDGDVVIDDSEPDVLVAAVDAQHGLMVGPKGRTLDAIQELARVSAQRTTPSSIRIKVDVGGYRRQRAEALETFAHKAADKAVDNGVEVALDPMSPADRKIIHDALNGDGRVETRSVGNEPRRKVLVVPVSSNGSSDGRSGEEE